MVDAKALYDLLIKDEIQAALGNDKRTAVETLVAQDKLRVFKAQVKLVSSEKQYADSMTKSDAAQLLADSLRSHQLRLTSDTNFQAAKKKTASQRKKGEEMYAIKKPSKALQAMAAAATTVTTTQAFNNTEPSNTDLNSTDDTFTLNNLLITMVFVMAIAHGFYLLPHLHNFITHYYNLLRHWFKGPDEPEPEEEDRSTPQLLEEPHDQGGDQPALQGDDFGELPAQDAAPLAAEPVDDPEPGPSLEDTVTNLEALVEHLREQLRIANEDNHRHYQQLQELLLEHERLVEQHGAAHRVAGEFYPAAPICLI